MGTYLSCGIATRLTVDKNNYRKEEILEELKGTIDLNIYKIREDENKMYLDIKEEVFEKYAIDFIEEQLEFMKDNDEYIIESLNKIQKIKSKKYDELVEIAKEKSIENFQFEQGFWICNDVSYLSKKVSIYADVVLYIFDGRAIMESYAGIFRYLRKTIIESSTNPIRTAVVITIIG